MGYSDLLTTYMPEILAHMLFWYAIIWSAVVTLCAINNKKIAKFFWYIITAFSLPMFLMLAPGVYYFICGYEKPFNVFVEDGDKKPINDFSIKCNNAAIPVITCQNNEKNISLPNKKFPKILVASHMVFDSEPRYMKKEDFVNEDVLSFSVKNNVYEVNFNNNRDGYYLHKNRKYYVDNEGVEFYTIDTKDNYISISNKDLVGKKRLEIRTRYSLLNSKSSYVVNIGDAIKVYVGEGSLQKIKIEAKVDFKNELKTVMDYVMPIKLELNDVNFFSVGIEKVGDADFEVVVSDNETFRVPVAINNVKIDGNARIKIGCYSEEKGKLLKLHNAVFAYDNNS